MLHEFFRSRFSGNRKHVPFTCRWKRFEFRELSNIQGIQVPEGFCVTTIGYEKAIEQNEGLQILLQQLTMLKIEERDQICEISKKIREVIMAVEIPVDVVESVAHHLSRFGDEHAYAVRSSATAEDLPYASFAGQQDTYLNIIGKESILQHIKKCWASLFTDRAVIYRMQNVFDHNQVSICVVVQKWFSLWLQGFYLLPIRLLRIGRCCQSMPALDLARR